MIYIRSCPTPVFLSPSSLDTDNLRKKKVCPSQYSYWHSVWEIFSVFLPLAIHKAVGIPCKLYQNPMLS